MTPLHELFEQVSHLDEDLDDLREYFPGFILDTSELVTVSE